MKKSKKTIVRFIHSFLNKYFTNSIYPIYVFLRTVRVFKKKTQRKKIFTKFSTNLSKINENEFKLSARLEIDYLNEEYNINIPKEEAYETLGGFIINQTENIPQKGEELNILNYQIIILNVSSSKIEEISLKILDTEEN